MKAKKNYASTYLTFTRHLLACCAIAYSLLPLAIEANEYTNVAQLINQRLSYMKDVARYKAEHHLPIEDLKQEDKVIGQSMSQAESLGLDGESIKPLMRAQINAAKAIQYRYRADWLSVPEVKLQTDLTEIRRKISVLSTEILKQLAHDLANIHQKTTAKKSLGNDCEFMNVVQQENLKETDKSAICLALKKVKLKN